jgi:tRNA pseudouridine55 synthase
VIKIDMPFVEFRVVCGKGTYIRQLAEDIGEKLGCGAHLTELRRTRSGSFSIEQAISFSDLLGMDREKLYESIVRI